MGMYGGTTHLWYGREEDATQATHQQHILVATRRWAKRSGTADVTCRALEPFKDNSIGPMMDVPNSVASA